MNGNRTIIIITFWIISTLASLAQDKTIKILAIGNSFSEDAVENNLYDICKSEGIKVIIGNMYVAGCSIDTHLQNALENKAVYRYRKIAENGHLKEKKNATLSEALKDEDWDFISFQQASEYSGIYDSYSGLEELLQIVRETVGEKPIFMWHMTWAYASKSTHAGFVRYGNSQLQMYHAIVAAARQIMKEHPQLKFIIPTGTAIQDARTAIIAGEDLTRDGYHLELNVGRYIAACTWYSAIFRNIIKEDVWRPKTMSNTEALIARDAAHIAVMHPWEITPLESIVKVLHK